MSSKDKHLSQFEMNLNFDLSKLKIGVITSIWNTEITSALKDGCIEKLVSLGLPTENITKLDVPGAFELPSAAKMLLSNEKIDAVICLGCVIKGETKHDDYISNAVAQGIMNLSILSGKPIIFGLVTTDNMQQAIDRSGGKYGNKGTEAAETALSMLSLKEGLNKESKRIGF